MVVLKVLHGQKDQAVLLLQKDGAGEKKPMLQGKGGVLWSRSSNSGQVTFE